VQNRTSLESGKKLGYIASLISVILPIAAIIGAVVIVIALIASAVSRIGTGTVVSPFFGFSAGLLVFFVAVGAVGLVGTILFLVAMHRLSNYYNEPRIFKNVLYALILSIVSAVIVLALSFGFILSSIAGISQTSTSSTPAPFPQFILVYVVVLGVSLAFAVVNAVLYMQAFNKLAEKSGIGDFKTTGLLYLIGTLLTIVAFGGILVWIAWIFAAMGFNKLKPQPTTNLTVSYPAPPPLSNSIQTKRCPNCGTQNLADALYCSNCGKPL
jgi:uncharacterized membrane protein